jgi:hypothetical protein
VVAAILKRDVDRSSLETLRGETAGVDASIYLLVSPLKTALGAAERAANPPTEMTCVLERCKLLCDVFEEYGIEWVAVFDGRAHPVKELVAKERRKAFAKASTNLRELLDLKLFDDYKAVEKQRKLCSMPNEAAVATALQHLTSRGVQCIGAPFEVDWTLASL